jgi:signal transduction histidine kinase
MVNLPKRQTSELRLILEFVREISNTEIVEQVYAAALNAIQELFRPDRGFVALSASDSIAPDTPPIHPGWLADVAVPIYAGEKLVGRFMLQYDENRAFSDQDLALIEIIAAQAGFAIKRIHEREAAHKTQRQKDELIAMAAHELRSPLTAIVGGAFLLRSGRDDVRALEMIERNARVQVTLIEELLHVLQLDAGKVELKMATLDLVPVLERVIEEIQPAAAAGTTAIRFELQSPMMIRGDAQRLWQIFWNLLSNSVRFASPNGEVQISGSCDSALAKICIRDNGIGISEDQLPYIFERFRQAHVPHLKSDGGLGLGLAIVKDLIALHGGAITAESDGPGKGACFTVTLQSLESPRLG